jgi:hypothetical protein
MPPTVVASATNLLIPRRIEWHDCHLVPGETYRLRAIIEGTSVVAPRAAAIVFDQAVSGSGLSVASVGAHIRLHTAPGLNRVDRVFTVDNEVSRFGLRTTEEPPTAVIRTLAIERLDLQTPKVDYFLTFDVEEGMNEFLANPLDDRVWCRTRDGEYGIRRLVAILDEHGLRGNFLIDFGSCLREGERRLREIVDYLLGTGHEVHAHLHTNKVAQLWGVEYDDSFLLEGTDYHQLRRLLDFTVRAYERCVGRPPRVFRSGSYKMGAELVLAVGAVGIEALSNVRANVADPLLKGDPVPALEPFTWENGVIEIPVDLSSPEAGTLETFLINRDRAVARKTHHRTCTLVMHSWSLLRRHPGEPEPDPERIERLHQICDLVKQGRAWGFGEYLDHRGRVAGHRYLSHIQPAGQSAPAAVVVADRTTCNVCDTTFSRATVDAGECPGCRSRPDDRRLHDVFATFGRLLDGRDVVALEAERLRRLGLTDGAERVRDLAALIASDQAAEGSVDCLVYLADLQTAITLAERLVRPGGLLIAPAAEDDRPPSGLQISESFDASALPGFDPVTGQGGMVVVANRATGERAGYVDTSDTRP